MRTFIGVQYGAHSEHVPPRYIKVIAQSGLEACLSRASRGGQLAERSAVPFPLQQPWGRLGERRGRATHRRVEEGTCGHCRAASRLQGPGAPSLSATARTQSRSSPSCLQAAVPGSRDAAVPTPSVPPGLAPVPGPKHSSHRLCDVGAAPGRRAGAAPSGSPWHEGSSRTRLLPRSCNLFA